MSTLSNPHIIDEVISVAHEFSDPSTLTACALVCSTWRDSSRRFVLRQIRLSSEARLDELTRLLDQDHSVRPLVRTLTVQPKTAQPFTPSSWVSAVPWRLFSKLPSLHTIRFADLYDSRDTTFGKPFIEDLSKFTTVERLYLSHNIFDLAYFCAMASALPELRHLHIDLSPHLPYTDYPTPPEIHELKLLSLGVEGTSVETFAVTALLKWIRSTPSSHTLRSLRLGVNFADAEETGRFLSEVGSGLVELDLTLEMVAPAVLESEVIRSDISLSKCTNLRSLALRHPRGPVCRALLELLAEVPSQDIRELTLGDVSIDDIELGNGIDPPGVLPNFSPLAALIQHSTEVLTVLYSGTTHGEDVASKLRCDLPCAAVRCDIRVRKT